MSNHKLKINNPELSSYNFIVGIIPLCVAIALSITSFNHVLKSFSLLSILFLVSSLVILFFSLNKVFQREGIEFDLEQNSFRLFKKNFLKETFDWKPLSEYTSLVILSKTGKKTLGNYDLTSSIPVVNFKVMIHELYIMKKDHIKRQFIVNYKNHQKVLELAQKLENLTNLKIETYSPTTSRKRRR